MKKITLSLGAFYIGISTLFFVLSSYLINIVLGRVLGPASYGVYGIILSLMTAVNLTQVAGLPQAVAKFVAEDEDRADIILRSGLILQVLSTITASILLLIFAPWFAKLLHDTTLTPYIKFTAFVFPLYGIFALYMNYYNGLHHFKTQALMNIVYAVAKFAAVIIFVYFFRVYGAIAGFIVAPFVGLIFWFHLPAKRATAFPYKGLIKFSIPLIALAVFSNLLQSIDLFFVKGLLHSNTSTGFYTASQNIAELPFYAVSALASVLFPGISKSVGQKLHERTKMLIGRAIRYSLLMITPAVLLISATSSSFLSLLYSHTYLPGANSLSILVIGSGFFTLFVVVATIISAAGSPQKSAVFAGAGLLLSSILCWKLIPIFGLTGAAVATSISTFAMMVIALITVYKQFKILIPVKSVIRIGAASIIVYLFAKTIYVEPILLPFLYIVLGIIYFALLFIFKEATPDDVAEVKNLLPKNIPFFKK